jgi:translation initiation factor 1
MGDGKKRPAGPAFAPAGVGGLGELLMARGLKKTERVVEDSAGPAPFAAKPAPPVEAAKQASAEAAPPKAATAGKEGLGGRVSLSMERAGRGGKTVTLVLWADRTEAERESLAQQLRKALGTGTSVEGERIVVQGEQRDRLRTWLTAHGVRDIRG